jgi:hypothetical protein
MSMNGIKNINMRIIQNGLYTKVLVWAYEKSEQGFTEPELFDTFDLNDQNLKQWYLKVFRDSPSLLINNINLSSESIARWSLTALGMSYAVSYLGLKEVEKGSKRAEKIAYWSIGIVAVIGLVQILIAVIEAIHH